MIHVPVGTVSAVSRSVGQARFSRPTDQNRSDANPMQSCARCDSHHKLVGQVTPASQALVSQVSCKHMNE